MPHPLTRAALLALTLVGPAARGATDLPNYIVRAIEDPARPAEQRARDGARRPEQLLAFAEVAPDQRVADFMSGGAYFTRLFSRVVGPRGHVYAFLPTEQLEHCAPEEVAGTRALQQDGR